MSVLILILCILGAVLLSSFLSRFLPRISTPLVQIVLGLIASQMPFFPDVQLDPELFLVLFIAPLLYLEAHEINKSQLLESLKLSLSLAIGLAIFTMVVVGFSLHALWPMFPLAAALALGAALGPTDAVAVSSLSHEATLTQRQIGVLKGESLFNDASGIVGFQFAIAAAVTGQFRVTEAAFGSSSSPSSEAPYSAALWVCWPIGCSNPRANSVGRPPPHAFSWSCSCRSCCIWAPRPCMSRAFSRWWPQAS